MQYTNKFSKVDLNGSASAPLYKLETRICGIFYIVSEIDFSQSFLIHFQILFASLRGSSWNRKTINLILNRANKFRSRQ